jgi:phage/plasmid-associated DNA primase
VRAATEEYFAEQDITGQWLEDCTTDGGPLAFTRTSDLFDSWKAWCEARNIKPGTSTGLSTALADLRHERGRESDKGRQRGFRRLVLKPR